ncbi:unnamed protein product [Clonostachys rosea f. rosea IK726]|uniref:Uncharacterized protein n=1 Tax=Clonostachys rosea f. rosea IK726 TaxID=1349383 RepID=A0ACA9UBU8_BIOOC|nr:unnamed protein product [Clonostachys rosea f. rosea IK726]
MASIPPAPDPAVAAAFEVSEDIELYIRVDEAEREQPVDCTYRPMKPAAKERGNYREKRIRDYWGISEPGQIKPIHPIARFMSYETFEQLYRAFRPYDPRGSYEGSFDCIFE